jgi:hypothetical protein
VFSSRSNPTSILAPRGLGGCRGLWSWRGVVKYESVMYYFKFKDVGVYARGLPFGGGEYSGWISLCWMGGVGLCWIILKGLLM